MQVIRCAVVGVLIALHLSADSWCHYIPEKKTSTPGRKNATSSRTGRIRICGNALTTFIIEACDGNVRSFNQVSSSKDSAQTKITEDCCDRDQGCTVDYLQNYCGESPLFAIKNPRPGKTVLKDILNTLSKNPRADSGPNARSIHNSRSKGVAEVHNGINRTWPSIQIGTVSPEMDKFGGQPIVVVKKNKSNSV